MVLARVELASGRVIDLDEFHLTSTYAGVIEGYPMARLNDAIIGRLPVQAGRLLPSAPVHLVLPSRLRPDAPPAGRLPFGPLELLPAVICMGRFSSGSVAAELDPVFHRSRLVIVWFQDHAILPASGSVTALRDVPWDDQAEDHEL